MLIATDVRVGDIVKVDGKNCQVLHQEIRGTGKFGKTVHLKLKSLEDAHIHEKSLRAEDKVEDVEARRVKMQYLYREGDGFVFMNSQDYNQLTVSAKAVGKQDVFLKENTEIDVLFDGEKPLTVDFPRTVELKVVSTAPPLKGGGIDTTYKEAGLENGLKILIPPFVSEGECVRVDTHDLSYIERVTIKSMKSATVPKPKEDTGN